MLRTSILFAFLAALAMAAPVRADVLGEATEAFVEAEGWQRQDVATIDRELMRAFTDDGASAMRPDESLGPLEKAVLLVETLEAELPRTRYMVRYGQMQGEEAPVSFVTVERYNMGPTIREMLISDYGAENVADAAEFGVGPHVAWRIVLRPLMGQAAAIMEAARREIGDAEAGAADCLGRECLALLPPVDELKAWNEGSAPGEFASPYPARTATDIARPARAAAELAAGLGLASVEDGEARWSGPEQPEAARGIEPFLFLSVDHDLGQDTGTDAMIGQTLLNDDAIAEIWKRRAEFPGMTYWFDATAGR